VKIPGEETDMIAATAKELNVFVAAMLYEYDTEWPDRYFNTMFLIDPKGKIVVRHRKMYIP
jgi:predicted amidohydrolase